MPESTTAIVGAGVCATASHSGRSPAADGQSCELQTPPCSSGRIAGVSSEAAEADPSTLLAVTMTRSVAPTSPRPTAYDAVFSSVISAQRYGPNRFLWYAIATGALAVQTPSDSVRSDPSCNATATT